MGAVQVMNVRTSVITAAVVSGVAVVAPQAAIAKATFTQADLMAVELDASDVSNDMHGASFSVSVVLPWFAQVRDDAAKALAEM